VVVDVGAHVGIFTLKSARRARLVIAVEPYLPNFKLLLANIKINRLENVIPVNVALGSYNGEAELYVATKSGWHTISNSRKSYLEGANSPISNDKLKVKLRTLDSIIKEIGVKKAGFIKIDAEGSELDILKGANNTLLDNAKMKVAIASYHLPEETKKIKDFLRQNGFKNLQITQDTSTEDILHGSRIQ
jgi:FkbM family methyltransferase